MSSGKNDNLLTLIWTIENFSSSTEDKWYSSPDIPTSYTGVKRCFGLKRNKSNNGECLSFYQRYKIDGRDTLFDSCFVNTEISLLASDGSVFVCKERNAGKDYLSGENLTVVFDLWKNLFYLAEGKKLQRIFARTLIGLQYVSFVWSIESYSSLKPYEERFFNIKEKVYQARDCKFELYFDDQNSIIINTSYQESLKKLKVSILDLKGKVVEFSEYLSKYENVKNDSFVRLVKLTSETMQRIMLNQELYFPEDVLSLRCEGLFQGEELDRYIENDSRVTVRNCMQVVQFLTNSDGGRSLLNKSNHIKNDVQGKSAYPSLNRDLKTMFEDECISDYTIKTQAKSLAVHKTVLCARSSVFRAMLTSEMREGRSDSLDMESVDTDTLHRFVLFLYTDELEEEMNWEEALKLYSIADQYDVLSLRERCRALLKSSLSTTNACDVLAFSDLHQDEDLKKTVIDYIWKHDNDIMETRPWLNLKSENGPLVLEAISEMYRKKRKG